MAAPAAEHARIFGQLCGVQVAAAVVRVFNEHFLCARLTRALACRRDFAGHLPCEIVIIVRDGAFGLVPVCDAGSAFNVRADKDFLHGFLLFHES